MSALVFVVDDSRVIRMAVTNCLQAGGFRVEQAEDGQEALDRLLTDLAGLNAPQLMITDVNMPRMDGLELIRRVRRTDHRFMPVLVLTTEGRDELKSKGKDVGATGWMVKPFDHAQLLSVTKILVRGA